MLAGVSLAALSACALPSGSTTGSATFQPVSMSQLPGWPAAKPSQALAAFVASCQRIQYFPPDQALGGSGVAASLGGKAALWGGVCSAAKSVPPADDGGARNFFQTYFQPYLVTQGGSSAAKITGYYEPEVQGSATRDANDQTPLLGLPPDLVTIDLGAFDPAKAAGKTAIGRLDGNHVVPYFDRFQIENGALNPDDLAIAWVADPVDAFFLQIEGSGRIDLPDGSIMRVTYAGKNGRPYVPIGRIMVQQKLLAPNDVTEQSIRAWLEAHPERARAIMDANPSYVFFRTAPQLPDGAGPPGALGVSLTPGSSIAVDRRYLPLGAPVWMVTTDPVTHAPLEQMTVAQDLGSAITGPLRADLFFGSGSKASVGAGAMNAAGQLYVLLPRPVSSSEGASSDSAAAPSS
ncbi:murein transglycosylase A [Acidisoma cellulosilytica]|uniref:peptidoglycan lytic exotransglycosylase n=1 Tax=Acidisoma cellulosilyticum TaxID=2802395 RepID=A0A964E265_9PROT|nr:MltA domain-containing protein [Acidisoma cellulosilyticum]MCB8879091.1 murein transglycosylase A [Acidisoma cellulosilyticum]